MDPARLGPFALLEKLGEGGMGVVYKARDTRLDRFVAIKLLPESRLTDADRLARFMQEARAASALNHPNIIGIYDIAEQDGRHYIVMEFVDGKPLHLIIPTKGMRLPEGLRIAAQIADALTAAHAAGIVHRDLKPGNIMVDVNGRTKVLDFGLAKLTAPRESPREATPAASDETRTVAMDGPLTEEGAIVGSVPYMSPEQAEGRPLDARSDIFSFGAVLYEMFTGQRAFQGESRISTLAAVVERDPRPASEAAPGVPPELERVIARCLRKDLARRSQHMSDVKLALEELRDESESGKFARPSRGVAPVATPGRRWLWLAVGAACLAIALAGNWLVQRRGPATPPAPQLVRVTPDDGYSYTSPAISPDGKFVASLSDRGGTTQVWLQQVGGGEPIQVTHSPGGVRDVSFFPDGTRLLVDAGDGGKRTLEVVPTLGGQARVVLTDDSIWDAVLSPDGRQVAYFDYSAREYHLNVIPVDGGTPRVLDKWPKTQAQLDFKACSWTSDSRNLLVGGSKRRDAPNLDEWDWFVLPLDGGDPVPTGAGDAIRAAGLGITWAEASTGDRLLFGSSRIQHGNVWEIRLTPGSWRVAGPPRQLTFGTESEHATSVSAGGTAALEISRSLSDFYLIPLDPETGHAAGPARRLTQDGRDKRVIAVSGDPGHLYFQIRDFAGRGPVWMLSSLDLASSRQAELNRNLPFTAFPTVSPDGRQIAWTRPEGGNYTISVGAVGAPLESARTLCRNCGAAGRFTPDSRYLVCRKEARVKDDPKQKYTAGLLDVTTGKLTPWLEDPAESVTVGGVFARAWILIATQRPGEDATRRDWIAPWRPEPIPRSEWTEFHTPTNHWNYAALTPYIYSFQDSQLMAIRFDAKQRRMSDPFPVRFASGEPVEIRSTDTWYIRGPGIVFGRQQTTGSVWLMKLP